ncbi:hypothetical protein MD484_g8068, partial [Candolleomyces efflorescens]
MSSSAGSLTESQFLAAAADSIDIGADLFVLPSYNDSGAARENGLKVQSQNEDGNKENEEEFVLVTRDDTDVSTTDVSTMPVEGEYILVGPVVPNQ